jgi:tetratricopeptide (TPR) repeat protein
VLLRDLFFGVRRFSHAMFAACATVAMTTWLIAQPDGDPIVQHARAGWKAARAAANSGGSPESLAPAAQALAELDKAIESSRWRLQGEYARSLVAAAIAAAQDERAEVEVRLIHAEELAERLESSAYPAEVPEGIDEAAGELWLEVDEYAEALKAYERVVARQPSAAAWLGLARSAAGLKDSTRACVAYRQLLALSTAEAEQKEARDYLARC